jgi:enamine deaminase RidA (YjgF/YER057c/UK114 family)
MSEIMRYEVNEEWAYSGIVEAGDFISLPFCEGNVGQSNETQVNGALDDMCRRLDIVDLSLESVVKVDVMMKDLCNIPIMEKVFKQALMANIQQGKPFPPNLRTKVV